MYVGFFQPLMDWIASHPTLAGMVVFAIAAGESLAVVGVLIPGVVLMLGIGALVGLGFLDLWSTMAWAVLGAIVGDGVSFWLGLRYRQQLQNLWPLSRYPDLLSNGNAFFTRHGGKSVLFGRFFGPVRAIIPAVAGMMQMPPWQFYSINILSAFAWAPVVLLPGVAFGAALGLAAEVASRLAIAFVLIIVLLWLTFWLAVKIYCILQPRTDANIEKWLIWGHKHPLFSPIVSAIFDPEYPETRGLSELAIILVLSVMFFAYFLQMTLASQTLLNVDNTIVHLVSELKSPPINSIMTFIVRMSDYYVTAVISVVISIWIIVKKHWYLIAHWITACAFGFLVPSIIGFVIHLPNEEIRELGLLPQTFPNLELTSIVSIYGFFTVVTAKGMNQKFRWIAYAMFAMFISTIVLARTFMGLHLFSTILGGVALGTLWVAVLGIAYRRRSVELVSKKMNFLFLLIPMFGIFWYQINPHQDHIQIHKKKVEISTSEWVEHNWRRFAMYRNDLENAQKHPFTLQWSGSADVIKSLLAVNGWQVPTPLTLSTGLLWFAKDPNIQDLPVLPHVHGGVYASILMTKETSSTNSLAVIRLWATNTVVNDSKQPVWIGNVSYLRKKKPWGVFVFAKTDSNFTIPLEYFLNTLKHENLIKISRYRSIVKTGNALWDGRVVLLHDP